MRKAPLKRRGRVKPVNRKRKRREFQRAYGGEARVGWVRLQRCLVCGWPESENAHVGNGGMGRKADASKTIPLCTGCHRALHIKGRQRFEKEHCVDLAMCAVLTERRWQSYLNERQSA